MKYLPVYTAFLLMLTAVAAAAQEAALPVPADTPAISPAVSISTDTQPVLSGEEQDAASSVTSFPAHVEHQKKQRIHKVWIWQETGDSLSKLAKKYYGDPKLWTVIYEANKDQISDPAIIYPKQELIIPDLDEAKNGHQKNIP